MSSLHREIHFETEICQHLGAHGWLNEDGAARGFDTARGLYLPDLRAWIEASQPEAWQRLCKTHGEPGALTVLADRLRKGLNERGTLELLRRGLELLGLKEPLALAQFKPALGLNPATQARYFQIDSIPDSHSNPWPLWCWWDLASDARHLRGSAPAAKV